MTPLVLILLCLGVCGLGAAGLSALPLQRWRLEHRGYALEVRNFAFHERVLVNGVVAPKTWVGGDHWSFAVHEVTLPDGEVLQVRVDAHTLMTMRCRVRVGDVAVFDSVAGRVGRSAPAAQIEDHRWTAAQRLLEPLLQADDPDLVGPARELAAGLRAGFNRLAAAGQDAQAHAALGGGGALSDQAQARLVEREADVAALIDALQRAHLAMGASTDERQRSLVAAHDLVARLESQNEVAAVSKNKRRRPKQRQ